MNLLALILTNLKSTTLFALMFTLVFSCDPEIAEKHDSKKQVKSYSIASPEIDNVYSYRDTVYFEITPLKKDIALDSVQILAEGVLVSSQITENFRLPSKQLMSKFGRQNIRLKVFYSDSLSQNLTSRIIILPDQTPEQLKYKLIGQMPHNPESSTQGLVYYEGNLYEGTGQLGKSRLMKIDPASGEVLLERNLSKDLFGEGIVIHDGKIFQLTYLSMIGFVYNLESFETIMEFDLQTSEGWGLTTDGESLIVSDGSNTLYFYDPVYFSQKNQLEVCDNNGLIHNLNELEYVDGIIWANIYGEKYILKIDAQNGQVIGKLDLTKLFPIGIPDNISHVLNGIAYNSDKNSYYITGKLWPVLYEIEIMP